MCARTYLLIGALRHNLKRIKHIHFYATVQPQCTSALIMQTQVLLFHPKNTSSNVSAGTIMKWSQTMCARIYLLIGAL